MKALNVILFSAILILTLGCAPKLVLAPSNPSKSSLPYSAADSLDGITILVETQSWSGEPAIIDHVTPVRITITNQSDALLRVRTSEFRFVGNTGKEYAALPPYQIEGSISQPAASGFAYSNFNIAPYCAYRDPTCPVYTGAFGYDSYYYGQYYPSWVSIPLPTAQMLKLALPDGVVNKGGYVTGFLYFQKISDEETNLSFTASLADATNGDSIGTITIPYNVIKKD